MYSCVSSRPSSAEPATLPASLAVVIRPRMSAPRGATSKPSTSRGSSRMATNVEPAVLVSLLMASTNWMTTLEPVGIVYAVFAATADGGCAGVRSEGDLSWGVDEADDVDDVDVDDDEVEAAAGAGAAATGGAAGAGAGAAAAGADAGTGADSKTIC